MRTIKFRAWDTRFNDMHYYADVRTWHLNTPDLEECTLMQYTGLKDENGKEIYEGDVVVRVEDVVAETIGGYQRYEPEGQIGSVEFNNGAFFVSGGNFYSYGEQMFLWSDLEVIGNIYEDPELLTKE